MTSLFALHIAQLILLGLVWREIKQLTKKETIKLKELDDLRLAVTQNTSVTQSAIQLFNGIADKVEDASPSDLEDLANQIRSSANALANAIVANTPAAAVTPIAPPNSVGAPVAGKPAGPLTPPTGDQNPVAPVSQPGAPAPGDPAAPAPTDGSADPANPVSTPAPVNPTNQGS